MASPVAIALLFLCFICLSSASLFSLSDKFIKYINSKHSTWKAGRNFPAFTPLEDIKKLMGALPDIYFEKLELSGTTPSLISSLPENFDPRDKWPYCSSLNEIRDQGSCGSCWAFGAAEAITDRICIHSKGRKQAHISAQDLLTCCRLCGYGCNGGYPSIAWKYWKLVGIVTGGNYNTTEGCRPYTIPACNHELEKHRPICAGDIETPECEKTCESDYDVSYRKDKHYGKRVYRLKGEEQIMAELYKNGPLEAAYTVYSDFLHYKSGVYRRSSDKVKSLGGHAVKLLGWGVENGTKYWLMANSWNTKWGDKGFFKILRGENHCGVEDLVLGGLPKLR